MCDYLVRTQNLPKNKISYNLVPKSTFAYQGVKNVGFSENFACALNDPLRILNIL